MSEQKTPVCEYAGDFVFKNMKTKACRFGGLSCYNYDIPELYEKCPERRRAKRKEKIEEEEKDGKS